MKAFADLYRQLDETTRTSEKTAAMAAYFAAVPAGDAAWALYFLSGRKPRQVVPVRKLCAWAMTRAGIPDWLFEECYDAVGDLAEAIALVLPHAAGDTDRPLRSWVEDVLLPLRDLDEDRQREVILRSWDELTPWQAFVWNKLLTGSFRVGVSQQLVVRALAMAGRLDAEVVAHRLMGEWQPTTEFYRQLLAADTADADPGRPYPFFLAHPLEADPATLGDVRDWQAEWKWDGIRAQLVRRSGKFYLWTRGEELVTDRYPELHALAERLPAGTVLDGELLPWKDGAVLPFAHLQRRIGRKTLGKKLLQDVPVLFMAYDLLEWGGEDVRGRPLTWRRAQLEKLLAGLGDLPQLRLSPVVEAGSWAELAGQRGDSRQRQVEGLMLKRKESPYRVGRQRGDWWKWKIEPYTIDAVLIYAQLGNGKRASLYTDYTFGVWDNGQLVPIAKAYSGLTDEEIRRVDAIVRQSTVDRFGPVRVVTPQLVFELGFEAIQRSPRHKSGLAVRFPRMLRWRTDKRIEDADTLDQVRKLLPPADTSTPAAD